MLSEFATMVPVFHLEVDAIFYLQKPFFWFLIVFQITPCSPEGSLCNCWCTQWILSLRAILLALLRSVLASGEWSTSAVRAAVSAVRVSSLIQGVRLRNG